MTKSRIHLISLVFPAFLGITLFTAQASAEVDAYAFVTSVCATSSENSYWKDGLGNELKNIGTTFVEGLVDAAFNPKEIANHITQDPYTHQMRSLILSDGFVEGINACYPDSQLKRDLLAFRIIFSGSLGYSTGAGLGFFSGLKLFSMATKVLGSTALPVLRYLGFSERVIVGLKRAGIISGYVAIGGATYNSIDEAITRYNILNAQTETVAKNNQALLDLQGLQNEIQQLISQELDTAVQAKLQQQLDTVKKTIELRTKLLKGELS